MKKFLPILFLLCSSPAFAQSQTVAQEQKTHRSFTYETSCAVETPTQFISDVCKIVETREKSGALRTRNIFSNRFGLTIKGRFDKEKGYMTWDSHNKYEYKWEYKVGGSGWTYVMPGFLLENVSWD
jgi:hypothetical protein